MKVKTVEKIGGTTMSRFPELIESLFNSSSGPLYNRIFVVSAYSGITDLLLEHKHSGDAGVYSLFSECDDEHEWRDRLTDVGSRMKQINADFFTDASLQTSADTFIDERIADASQCLTDVQRICTFGPFAIEEYLMRVRDLLSSIGEAHSAHNATLLLRERGINARFIDLTGWRDARALTLDERIGEGLEGIAIDTELPVLTGYAQCTGGLVRRYGRGYTEITMSRVAVLTGPSETVIHKEYHLSSADPKILGVSKVLPIGRTNYDVADQLSNLGMEAIHPSAASMLRKQGIPLRVKHAFEPAHAGTLIETHYKSDRPRVEIIAGRRGLMAIEVFDQDMVGEQMGYESRFNGVLERFKVRSIGKDMNANALINYVSAPLRTLKRLTEQLGLEFPGATVTTRKVAFVCAVGTDMDLPGILARCATALGDANVPILSVSQPLRGIDARFVVTDADYQTAVCALHAAVIETNEPRAMVA
jgi:aspartate kinase